MVGVAGLPSVIHHCIGGSIVRTVVLVIVLKMDGNQRTSPKATMLRKRMKKGSKKLSGKTSSPFVRKLPLSGRALQPSSARGTASLPDVNLRCWHVRSVFPTSREELHRCTMVHILRCLAERLYAMATERSIDRRMIRNGSAFVKGLMTHAGRQDQHLGIGGQKLQVKECAPPTEKNTLVDEWPPSEKQLEQWVSEVVGSINCFRTILIPVHGILNGTSLLREAYRTVIDGRPGQPALAEKIVHHFQHEFQHMQKNKFDLSSHRRKIIMSQEIQLSINDCWTALCSSVGPHVLTPNNLYGKDAGSVEMYENLHLRLCHAFGRRLELTRQAFPEMDWAADHTVEILLDTERRTVQSFSKRSMQQSLMKIVEIVVGPYDKEKNLKALKLLYECLFVVETKVEAGTGNVVLVKRKKEPVQSLKSLSVVGQRRARRSSEVLEPAPKTNVSSLTQEAHNAHIASSLCALFLKPLTHLLPRIEDEVGDSAAESVGNDNSVRSLLARNRLHLNPYVRQMLNTIWNLVDVDGDGVLNKSEYETMHAKLMLLHYSPHVPDVGTQRALRAHDWAAEAQLTDKQDHPRLHRAGFVANWLAGLSEELTRRMSALEFTHFLNWTFSQVARYDRKRKRIKWRNDVDIARRSKVLAQNPDSKKQVADFFEQLRTRQQQPQTLSQAVITMPAPLLKTVEADLDFSYLDQHHTREDASKRLQELRYAVTRLKEKAKVDATTKFSTALDAYSGGGCQGLPPLHAAVRAEDEENVALLLAGGVDPLVKDEAAGRTPLHLAVEWGNCRVLFLLVEVAQRKPLINLPANNGQTPLMMAAALDRPKCLQTLLDFGADPKLQDEAGMTALDHASSSVGHKGEVRNRCFEILKCYQLEDEEMPLQRLPEDTTDDGGNEEEASAVADFLPPGIPSSFVDAVSVNPTSPTSLALTGLAPSDVLDGYDREDGNVTEGKGRQSQSRSQHLYNDASNWVNSAKFEKLQIVKASPAKSKTNGRARSPFSNHRKEREWPQVKSGPGGMPSGIHAPAMGSPNKNVIASNFKAVPISPFSSTVMRLYEEVNQEHGVQAIEKHGTPWEVAVYEHPRPTSVDSHQKLSMQHQQGTYVLNGLSPVQSSPDLGRAPPSINNIIAGPSKGYIDPAVREEILQERESRIREMHPSQRAILDGLNVQVMVSSLTRSMKIPRKRPSSAATLRNKPGILSRALRSNTEATMIGRRKRPKSASRMPSSSTQLTRMRGNKQEKRRCKVRPPFIRAKQLAKEEDDIPGPWEMFSEGKDFRSLSLGTNAAPRQPIVIPTVFS